MIQSFESTTYVLLRNALEEWEKDTTGIHRQLQF